MYARICNTCDNTCYSAAPATIDPHCPTCGSEDLTDLGTSEAIETFAKYMNNLKGASS